MRMDSYVFSYITRCRRGVRVVFSRARMRSSNSALTLLLRKSCSVHMTVFVIVAHRNVDNWIQLLT